MGSGSGSEGLDATPLTYRVLRALARVVIEIFYRRVDVVGLDRVPRSGPLVLAANHQNALVDGILLVGAIPRRLRPVAKAPLFRYPGVGLLLRLLGAIPVHRRQEGGTDPGRNETMFTAAGSALSDGGAVLIFPEGVSQPEPTLMPVRTGAARLLLAAEGVEVTLLPVGLVFHEPGTFRTGWALVLVGEPIPTEDCRALYRSEPDVAVERLTERLARALRLLVVEAGDRETLRLIQLAEAIWRAESSGAGVAPAASAEWRRRAVWAYRHLRVREPERVRELRLTLERYAKDLALAGVTASGLAASYSLRVAASYTARQGAALVLGLPLALWGIVIHGVPYRLASVAMRLLRPDPDVEATYKITAALALFPLCWAAEGWVAWRLGGSALLALLITSIVPTAFFALTWSERLRRVAREARSLLRFMIDRDLCRHLVARRQAIAAELASLVDLVPLSVRAGPGTHRS